MKVYVSDRRRCEVIALPGDLADVDERFGARGSGIGEFERPRGLASDDVNQLLVADAGNHRIVSFDPVDFVGSWQEYGTFGSGVDEFDTPTAVHVDEKGVIWIADTGNRRVVRVDSLSGSGWAALGPLSGPTSADPDAIGFLAPTSLAHDAAGRIYVTDVRAGRVVRIDEIGGWGWSAIGPFVGGVPLAAPVGVCAIGDTVLVVDVRRSALVEILDVGTGVETFVEHGAAGVLVMPSAMASESSNVVYVTDPRASVIVQFVTEGAGGWSPNTTLSSIVAEGEPRRFDEPVGIAIAHFA